MGRWCWPRNIYIWPIGNLLDDHIKKGGGRNKEPATSSLFSEVKEEKEGGYKYIYILPDRNHIHIVQSILPSRRPADGLLLPSSIYKGEREPDGRGWRRGVIHVSLICFSLSLSLPEMYCSRYIIHIYIRLGLFLIGSQRKNGDCLAMYYRIYTSTFINR
jgi:hypothetical protein